MSLDSFAQRLRVRGRESALVQTVYRRLHWYLNLQFANAPASVALETGGPCNRTCSYCPVSIHTRTGEMPRELFEKIIDDLAAIHFSRTLSFHFYNEPLMDKRLPRLVAHARARLPRCVLDLSTNGDYLSTAIVDELFEAGLDDIHVSLHSESAEKHVRVALTGVREDRRKRVTVVSMFDREEKGEFLYNRIEMAEAPSGAQATVLTGTGCSNVNALMINYTGESGLCCNDFFATNGHGSLKNVSVGMLWRSSRPVRKRIYLGEFDKPICQICNVGAALS